MTLAHDVKEVLFLRELLNDMDIVQNRTIIMVDNQSNIHMAKIPIQH